MLSRAADAGYLVRVFGFYLPYRAIVGDAAVEVHAEPNWPKRRTIAGSVAWSMVRNLEFMGNPLLRLAGRAIFGFSYDRYWYEFNRRLEDSVRARLRAGDSREFVFAHIGLPHGPFVFAADGSFQGDSVAGRMEPSPSKYAVHLRYVDGLIGRVLGDLRAAGLYDQALIVITADHNWKVEPDWQLRRGRNWALSVPLVMKFPGQRKPMRVEDRTCLVGLEPFLERARGRAALEPSPAEVERLSRESCDRGRLASTLSVGRR